ncbi:L,D-transpeptidase [Verrucomicrobia bacterium LW23]|nr:L,D-transpeptidase [Verrucomicrobia bacterium LW23]
MTTSSTRPSHRASSGFLVPALQLVGAFAVAAACVIFVSGCQSIPAKGSASTGRDDYDAVAYKPKNPDRVTVKVSIDKQMIYVLEDGQPLLVTATCVGTAAKPTPLGNFRVTGKIIDKRSNTYGFWKNNDTGQIIGGESRNRPAGNWSYKGYPMGYWVEFHPGYGFHQGYVWPQPRTHGCLRLHHRVAPKFYQLVKVGTPINIAHSQPEDATLGAAHTARPTDYLLPDPPMSVMISPEAFSGGHTVLQDR